MGKMVTDMRADWSRAGWSWQFGHGQDGHGHADHGHADHGQAGHGQAGHRHEHHKKTSLKLIKYNDSLTHDKGSYLATVNLAERVQLQRDDGDGLVLMAEHIITFEYFIIFFIQKSTQHYVILLNRGPM